MVKNSKIILSFVIVALSLLIVTFWAINTGTIKVSLSQLYNGLFVNYDKVVATIYDLRFPRIIVSIFAGASIATSGVLLQATMKNSLADPGILGISSGASLTSVIIMVCFPHLFFMTPIFACIGGMCTFLLVFSLSFKDGLSPMRVILIGIAINTMFIGILQGVSMGVGRVNQGVASIANTTNAMKTWEDVKFLSIYASIVLFISLSQLKKCNILLLDDKTARGLGINVDRSRLLISAIGVALASISTSIVGPISFLGLIVPHIGRLLVGSDHKRLVPFSMILGAFVFVFADTLGRAIMPPIEISPMIVMSIMGGPFFIFLLRRSNKTYGS